MENTLQVVKEKLGKPYEDLEFLLDALKEVLIENGEDDMAREIPWINDLADFNPDSFNEKHVQLYSIIFTLINTVEVNGAVQNRRMKEDKDLGSVRGLWADHFRSLKDAGISMEEILKKLPEIRVEPVLTAHPTEAKRATVLEHHRDLYLLLVQKENTMFTSKELDNIRENIKLTLFKLWKTGEIFMEKPDVKSELKNIVHYMENVFPKVIPVIDRRMDQAWKDQGYDIDLIHDNEAYPRITFGDWVGGDRDGHPLITAQLTDETLSYLRLKALKVIRERLVELVKSLSFAQHIDDADEEMRNRVYKMMVELEDRGEGALNRNKGEAFRQFVNMMLVKLPIESTVGHDIALAESKGSYITADELLKDLRLLRKALINYGARSVANTEVRDAIRTVSTFGFHLACIDIRQNSDWHDLAISQLMEAAGIEDTDFPNWSEEKRVAFLNEELLSSRPFTNNHKDLGANAKAVIDCYKVVASHIQRYGTSCVGSFIVSMTRSLSDLLAVYVLAREAGLVARTSDGYVSVVHVVPLLETIEDLENGPEIMGKFLSHPYTKRSLAYQQKNNGEPHQVQQIMVGYSDSNKDGGILASQWNLYKAQYDLETTVSKHGIGVRFFHGKGGSISRGAGPTHYFMSALPHSAVGGNIRLTEQGETIEQKYANKVNAAYNLELLAASAAGKSILSMNTKKEHHPYADILDKLAKDSQEKYASLLNEEGFIPYFRQATPIDAIENSKIGSRPAKRRGDKGFSIDDLRAIPWVFSWGQARCNMTSWFGIGTTLDKLKTENPSGFESFKKAIKTDPFIRYVLTNVDTSLAATDEDVMLMYADLVEDKALKDKFVGIFLDELKKTRENLSELLGQDISVRREQHYYSNTLRASLMISLHKKQVVLLKKWRKEKASGIDNEETVISLLTTINAIAGAMRNTG